MPGKFIRRAELGGMPLESVGQSVSDTSALALL